MLLAIDQGNTRTKLGIFSGTALQYHWNIITNKYATATELAQHIMPTTGSPLPKLWGLCSVVPEQLDCWSQVASSCGATLTIFTGRSLTSLRNAYFSPDSLGADRLLAAVAAAHIAGTPVIPVSLGTATVVDAVSADATYLGGLIAPGIGTSMSALAGAASALNHISWKPPASVIGQSSHDAMVNGLFYQQTGGIRAMILAVRRELECESPVVLTGGWATQLAPHLEGVAAIDEFLVLRGIALTISASLAD